MSESIAASTPVETGSTPPGNTQGNESAEEKDPAKTPAVVAKVDDDPEFEYEVSSKDKEGKDVKEKRKIKKSEALARVSSHDERDGKLTQREQLVQKYITEQLDPLNGMVESMRKDPAQMEAFARRLGVDFDKAVHAYAQRQVALANMTPEQRELHATKQELSSLKKQDEDRKAQEAEVEQQEGMRKASEQVQQEIVTAAKEVKLPADPAVLMLMTNFLRSQVKGGSAPDTRAAAAHVKKVLDSGFKSMLKDLTYDQIKKDFPEILTKIREGDILEVRGGFAGNGAPRPPKPAQRQSRAIMSESEFQRYLKGEE